MSIEEFNAAHNMVIISYIMGLFFITLSICCSITTKSISNTIHGCLFILFLVSGLVLVGLSKYISITLPDNSLILISNEAVNVKIKNVNLPYVDFVEINGKGRTWNKIYVGRRCGVVQEKLLKEYTLIYTTHMEIFTKKYHYKFEDIFDVFCE